MAVHTGVVGPSWGLAKCRQGLEKSIRTLSSEHITVHSLSELNSPVFFTQSFNTPFVPI